MKGIIGIPHTGQVPMEFVKSLLVLDRPDDSQIFDVPKSAIHVAREMLVTSMMKHGAEWLFFIDADMTFPPNLLTRLLSHNAPVVTAMAFKRVPPYTPCFYEKCEITENGVNLKPYEFDMKPTEPFTVEACGAACLLIRKEVFEKIKYPWFLPLPFTGEDISFSLKLKGAGIPILVDPVPIVGHLEERSVNVYTYLEEQNRLEGAL
ncbi:MAG: hypothetical protein KMY55_09860 [Dethiosulfatibacter sp.]|nr:hypothetical protein [Dethiosulfatibacter sp.]